MSDVKRVEAWVTSDGSTFSTERAARVHEAGIRLLSLWMHAEKMPPAHSEGFVEWMLEHSDQITHALRPLDTQSTPKT